MITFRDFMESSLYDPTIGFYSRRRTREDFYTAPELHPAFAQALTSELVERLKSAQAARPGCQLSIVEAGAGEGRLARQILECLKTEHPGWIDRIRYVLIERVETVLLDAIESLQDTGARLMGVTQIEDLQPITGVIFSNELFDAFPVHLLQKHQGRMKEVYVDRAPKPGRKHGTKAVERLGLLSSRALVHEARRVSKNLPEGGRHAICLESPRWIRAAAARLRAGSVLTIDYGGSYGGETPNAPRTFFKHTTPDDLIARPGRQDLTASVDFDSLKAAGNASGLIEASYTTMGRFLLSHGILDRMPEGDDAYAERSKIKTLIHPEGMGDKFKVLIQEKGLL